MPSTIVYCPGLAFAMLIFQSTSAKAAIPFAGTGNGGDGCADGDDCTTSFGMMHGTLPTSSKSSVSPISSTSRISPASSSSTVTANVVHRPKAATAGIVGATLGSLIVVGLLLMLLAKYMNRIRKARKRPVGFGRAFPDLSPLERTNALGKEMSQSQSITRASDSTPLYTHAFNGEDRSANPPSSPLVAPSVPLGHSFVVDASSPSNEHNSSDASSSHEPLQSPYETSSSSNSSSLPLLVIGGHGAGSFPSSSPLEPSGLHSEIAAFQKVLEAGVKGHDAQLTQQTSQLETRGPPPNYYE